MVFIKNLFSILLVIFCFTFSVNKADAATKYWVGGSGGSFSSDLNWSTSSGGANNTTAPGVSDIATFDSGDVDNAAVDTLVSVAGINIISTYSGTISQSANLTVGTSNFVIAGGAYNMGSATSTFNGAFTQSGGVFTASSATTTFKGNFTHTSGTFTHNSGTVVFDGSVSNNTIAANSSTFNNVSFYLPSASAVAPVFTITQNFTTTGNLSISSDHTAYILTVQSQTSINPTITVQGTLSMPNGAANSANLVLFGSATAANNLTVNLQGNFSMVESSANYYATTVYTGTGDQTISKTAGIASSTMSSTKVSGNLNITTYSGTVSSDKILWASGSITTNNGTTLGGLTVSGGTFSVAAGTGTISGTFTLSGGTFIASSGTTTFNGNFTRTSGTFTHNSGIVDFFHPVTATVAITSNGVSFNNVHFRKDNSTSASIMYIDDNMSISGYMKVSHDYSGVTQNLEVKSRNSTNPTITVQGNLEFPNIGASNRYLGSTVASEQLTVNLQGNLIMSSSVAYLHAPIVYTGTGDQTITHSAGTIGAASTWSITKTSGSAILSTTLTHPSSITVATGTLDLNANNLTVTSTFSFASSTTLKLRGSETVTSPTLSRGSTVYYYGTSGPYTLKSYTYHHITIDGLANTFTAPATLNVNGDLTITAGTLASGGFNFNIHGNWSNSGTYTHSNNTVSFTGANQAVRGSAGTTFYNFSKATSTADTFTFPSAVTTTISNNTTLTGISGQKLSIQSDISGSQSSVNFSNSGTRSIQYVNVKDNNNTNATAVTCTTACTNQLNNTNWIFVTGLVVTTQAASSLTTTGATLNGTITATGGEDATQHGFAYGTSAALATVIATTTLGVYSSTGSFTESISSLSCDTTYYSRPYATNSAGTSYGSITSFATVLCTGGGSSGSRPSKTKTIPPQAQNNPLISGTTVDGQYIIIAPGQDFIMKVKPINPGQLKKLTLFTDDREIPFTPSLPPIYSTETPLPPIKDVVYEAVVAFSTPDVYPYVIVAEYASSTLITRGNFNVRYSSSNENNIRALPGTDYSEVEKPSQPISEKQYESLLQDPKEFLRRDTGIVKLYNTVGEFIKDPTISLLSKILRALGIVMGSFLVISGLLKNPFSIAEILSVPTRLMSILLSTLGLKKKNHPWGTVYDSMTKQPIDPAIVTLYDVSGNEVGSCITDLDGRYSFLVPPGTYTITAAKTNYSFPSKKLTGRSSDELYPDLYFGEQITITSASDVVAKNIPLDREKFDWNEYAKSKSKVMSFYTKWDVFIQKISSTFFISGFGLSILSIIYIPEPYNFIILILYIIISISYILGIRPRLYGTVKDKDGNPLSMGIIRFRYLTLGDEILHRVIDEYGRYYALVPKGSYVVSIEKKNTDGSYEPVYTSAVINADKGIIKKRFVV